MSEFTKEMYVLLRPHVIEEVTIGIPMTMEDCGFVCSDLYVKVTHSELLRRYELTIQGYGDPIIRTSDDRKEGDHSAIDFKGVEVTIDKEHAVIVTVLVSDERYDVFVRY